MHRKEVTMTDIAREVGVSVSAVSRALRGDLRISQETRDRIAAAADRFGYQRADNSTQRSKGSATMAGQQDLTKVIVLVSDDSVQKFYSETLLYITKEAYEFSFQTEAQRIPAGISLTDAARQFVRNDVHALILFTFENIGESQARACAELPIPAILVNRHVEGLTNSVTINEYGIGLRVARYFYALGHRRIGYLSGNMLNWSHHERASGYKIALEQLGCFAPELMRSVDLYNPIESCHSHMQQLLALPEPPTALWATSDYIASLAVAFATAAGVEVPANLSVIGFGKQSDIGNYELTTCDFRPKEIGRHVLFLLDGLLRNTVAGPTRICIDPLIIEGRSTSHFGT